MNYLIFSLLITSIFAQTPLQAFKDAQRKLVNDKTFADVKIHVDKFQSVLYAHSSHLVAQSPIFTKLLAGKKPGEVMELNQIGISSKCMKALLHYMYTGELTNEAYSDRDLREDLILFGNAFGLNRVSQALVARTAISDEIESLQVYYEREWIKPTSDSSHFLPSKKVNRRIAIYQGDIALVNTTAVVNAANRPLQRGSGVDDAIHKVAGPELQKYCNRLGYCKEGPPNKINAGDAIAMPGFSLPAEIVIATAAPTTGNMTQLEQCYENSYELVKKNGYTSIAFPCLGTGVYGFPKNEAAHIALSATRKFLDENEKKFVVLVLYEEDQVDRYVKLLPEYFPPAFE